MADDTLLVDEQNVAYDIIDGEVIVVHFVNGNYFALNDTAAMIWQGLVSGNGVSAIASHIQATFPNADVEQIRSFTGQLVNEGLMAPGNGKMAEQLPALDPSTGFEPPMLEKHEDMQKLIMLDPIHEVDDAGWPHEEKT